MYMTNFLECSLPGKEKVASNPQQIKKTQRFAFKSGYHARLSLRPSIAFMYHRWFWRKRLHIHRCQRQGNAVLTRDKSTTSTPIPGNSNSAGFQAGVLT